MISQYWRNQIPARPLYIEVKDQSGYNIDLSTYTSIEAVMVGSNNEFIDLSGSSLNAIDSSLGKLNFVWPTDRSLFEFAGDYVFQLKLSGTGKLDFTTTHPIRVKELGRIQRGNVYNS